MKAVSLIVQFVLFFIIGLGFFILAGNFFRFQSTVIRQELVNFSSEFSVREVSVFAISAVDSCKSCDNVTLRLEQKSVAGYNPTYQISNVIRLKVEQENVFLNSSLHNLNYSINLENAEVSSSKPIDLMYDRTKNKLVIK